MQVISWLLIGESLWNALWLAQKLSTLAVYDGIALTVIALRALTTMLQFTAGWWILRQLPPARTLAIVAFLASAVLLVFEVGLRLGPTSVIPGWEWVVVAMYSTYAVFGVAIVASSRH